MFDPRQHVAIVRVHTPGLRFRVRLGLGLGLGLGVGLGLGLGLGLRVRLRLSFRLNTLRGGLGWRVE